MSFSLVNFISKWDEQAIAHASALFSLSNTVFQGIRECMYDKHECSCALTDECRRFDDYLDIK